MTEPELLAAILAAREAVAALGNDHGPAALALRTDLRRMEQVYEAQFGPLPAMEV
ncbi:MAG: hypothetical protein ACOY7L_17300 [Pseudomonadota bacterium]